MELRDGSYQIQGIALTSLAEEFGTPLYVYNASKIQSQYQRLASAFDGVNVKIRYAAKALTNMNILKVLKKCGSGIDAVCINEVKLALQLGFTPDEIMYTPNCVHFSEIEEAIELGVHINIDNLPFLEKLGSKYIDQVPVCIRINPHITAGGNRNIQVGHVGSKFGISILQFDEVLKVVDQYGLNVEGLHIHTGSDILEAEVFLKVAEVMFKCARNFTQLRFLDFGSGFKVAYKPNDHVTDIEDLGIKLSAVFKDFCTEYGKDLELWFEPGKFMVSESGHLLVNVNIVKDSPACTFVGVDSGFNHLIRPMMYDSHHEIVNISNPNGEKHVYNVVGNICETDTFASDRKLAQVSEEDKLVFLNAGAYGFEMSSNFNSRLKPAEVMILEGKAHLIRERDDYNDLLRKQVEVNF